MNTTEATIFIVDDDPAIRDSLTLMVVQEGFTVSVFESAEAFLENFQAGRFGCAIVDIRMPGLVGLLLREAMSKSNSK